MKNQPTKKERDLKLLVSELKKEVSRLQRKNAKLEVQMFSAKRHEAQMRKFTTTKPLISEKSTKKVIELFLKSKKTQQKLPAP